MKLLRGFRDILHPESARLALLENEARETLSLYGYREIRLPALEETQLFVKSTGETTDIVEKEMYSFRDRGGRDVTLRPEGTPQVARAFVEHNLHITTSQPFKFFYIGDMFRAERPQAGRFREFGQIGVEYLGNASPFADAESITLLANLAEKAGVENCAVEINSLGCEKCRREYREVLLRYLDSRISGLCDSCRKRYSVNPLRVLDCKTDREKLADSPAIDLCPECAAHFQTVGELLSRAGVNFKTDKFLVRGLDYYTRTVFELKSPSLGSQDALGAGGRYDNLIKAMRGPNTPAVGWAMGSDRLLSLSGKRGVWRGEKAFIVCAGRAAEKKCFEILETLRNAGISANSSNWSASLRSQMRAADKRGCSFAVIIGDDELEKSACTLKNLLKGGEKKVPFGEIVSEIKNQQV